ncbi:MAG: MATE family efflux transporter [Kiritimatiellae bacterium]|nr:MATE family efflux transporter [Kiritimatiellia bacterium]
MHSPSRHLAGHFTCARLLRFALPMIGTVIFTSIYSIVDGFFVSNWLGKKAFAGVNLVFPFAMLLAAFGVMVGTGGNALVAIRLGRKAKRNASRLFTTFLLLDFGLGAALSALGLIALRPVMRSFGTDGAVLENAVLYGTILLAANPLGMLQYFFQTFMVTAGRAKANAVITVAAGFTNAVLDALFIIVFGWGLAGAALASAAGMAVGGLVPLVFFRKERSAVGFATPKWAPRPIMLACGNGASELMTAIAMPSVAMLYNFQLLRFAGADGVAAWGAVMYLSFVFVSVFLGYAMAVTPVVGYQFGAGENGEQRGILRRSLAILGVAGGVMAFTAFSLSGPLARVFTGYDEGLLALTRHAFAVCAAAFIPVGWNIFASAFFTGLGKGALSAAIAFIRTFLFEGLAVIILPFAFALEGVWWSAPVAEFCSAAVALSLLASASRGFSRGLSPQKCR